MPKAKEPWLTRVTMPRPALEKASFEASVARFYSESLDALDDAGVPTLLGGAAALNHYTGIWRDTKDLDLFLRPRDVERALATLEGLGCKVEVQDPVWLSKAHGPDGIFLDLIHANSNGTYPVDDAWFDRAGNTELLGKRIPIVSAEDILLSKMFVGSRDRWDGADVMHLLYTTGLDLDWDLVLERGRGHWELLLGHLVFYRYAYPDAAERVPAEVWRTLTGEWTRALEGPPVAGGQRGFRGRLLDPISFDVDVDGWGFEDARERQRARAELGGGRYW